MELNTLKEIHRSLSEHRKNLEKCVTEGVGFDQRSNALKDLKKSFQEKIKESGIKNIDELKKDLKSIQAKCEKDNTFAKKSIEISRVELIDSLMKAHGACGDKLVSFTEKSFKSGEKFIETSEDTEKAIKKVNDLCDEVFSFKDTFSVVFVTNTFLRFIKSLEDIDIALDVIDNCISSVYSDEDTIEDFSNLRHDIKIEGNRELMDKKEEINLIHKKLNKLIDLIRSYNNLTFKIYNKTYTMIKHHIDTYK